MIPKLGVEDEQRYPSPMSDNYTIRNAISSDLPQMLALLPELTDFPVPPKRNEADLWSGDAELMRATIDGAASDTFIDVAVDASDAIMGFIMVTMREELMSHAPSAHLETIIVAPNARGQGLGRRLLTHTEQAVRSRGAQSLSLHVFANNRRAHALYTAEGFDSELIRAIKWLD